MLPAAIPTNEPARLAELYDYDILDTVSEATYDAITFLASQICGVPIALISIVDQERQWFKSRVGLEATETHRDLAFCAHAINDPRSLFVVPDASADVRFFENPLVTDDPSIRFYAGAPLVTPEGNALGTLCVIDRKPRELSDDQEASLRALSVQVMALLELRRTVRELETHQRQLEETTRQRDSLMATVSHELRTPLTAVIGYIELLQEDLPEAERTEILGTVARQAADVEYLIEDLLIAAKAEADSLRVAAVPVQLHAQVAQVLEGFEPSAVEPIALQLDSAGGIGDPARVRQIIRNLVTNAFRYGGPNVSIRTFEGDGVVHVVVGDDGDGIPATDRENVFQPFKQASNARHVASSIGLGLPISRLLAQKMGGDLTYRFADGVSRFELTIPAAT